MLQCFKLNFWYRQRRSQHGNWRDSGEAAAEKGIAEQRGGPQRKAQRRVECQADPAHSGIYRRDGREPQEKEQRGAVPADTSVVVYEGPPSQSR